MNATQFQKFISLTTNCDFIQFCQLFGASPHVMNENLILYAGVSLLSYWVFSEEVCMTPLLNSVYKSPIRQDTSILNLLQM